MPSDFRFNLEHWSLANQGRVLVILLLVTELSLIGTLAWLVGQAEAEAAKLEHARQTTARASRLMLVLYDTGDSVGRLARSLQSGDGDTADKSQTEVPNLLKWLKESLKNNAQASQLLARIDANITQTLPVLNEIKDYGKELADPQAKAAWDEERAKIQPNVNELVKDIPVLITTCKRLEQEGPIKEEYYRQISRNVLIAGLAINILAAVLIAWLFLGRITSRLDRLKENTIRLKQGQMLLPLLSGSDELARVDRVFHETAQALRREMQLLKANEQRVRNLIENLPIGLAIVDSEDRIEFVNADLQKSFMYTSDQLIGQRLVRLFKNAQEALSKAQQMVEQNSVSKSFDMTGVRQDGQDLPVDFRLAAVDLGGEPKTLAMILDATEKFKLQQVRQNFVSMVRTELKQPLSRLATFLSLFYSGAFGPLQEKGLGTTKVMQQNVDRLILLLNDLFDLDKLESGKIDIDPAPCSLNNVFERSVDAVSIFAQKHKVAVTAAPTNLIVFADGNRLVQVLVNLVSNAIKFSPPESTVSIAVRHNATHVEVGVIDRGRGIPADQVASVFEAYTQVEAGDATKKGGTGLGLTICKAIVEAHQGKIGVNSEWGKGSVFWFSLPLNQGAGQ